MAHLRLGLAEDYMDIKYIGGRFNTRRRAIQAAINKISKKNRGTIPEAIQDMKLPGDTLINSIGLLYPPNVSPDGIHDDLVQAFT